MRRPILAANWKMNKTQGEARAFAEVLLALLAGMGQDSPEIPEAVVCPTFTALAAAAEAFRGSPVRLGAQNLYPAPEGAFTGEISPDMLRELGCAYVILGHSERRQYFGETDEFINQKVKAAYAAGLTPILCVGETLEERQAGRSEEVCLGQLTRGLAKVGPAEVCRLVVAYEPVWAIGTGMSARPEDARAVAGALRRRLEELYGPETAARARLQYGGSVRPENIKSYLEMPDIDGALIGGAGLKASSFAAMWENARS